MDTFVEAMASFEKIHSWWSDETFMKAENKTLKNFVYDTLYDSPYIEELATNGMAESIETLIERLKDTSPKMLFAVLINFLDYLYLRDTDHIPHSKELVKWYRENGWQFPEFSHEVAVPSSA